MKVVLFIMGLLAVASAVPLQRRDNACPMTDVRSKIWSIYQSAIVDMLSAGHPTDNLIVVNTQNVGANWTDATAQSVMDTYLNNMIQWNPSYQPTGEKLPDAYSSLLSNYAMQDGTAEENAELDTARTRLADTTEKYATQKQTYFVQYFAYVNQMKEIAPTMQPMTWEQWLGAFGYGSVLVSLKQSNDMAFQTFWTLATQIQGVNMDLAQAIQKFTQAGAGAMGDMPYHWTTSPDVFNIVRDWQSGTGYQSGKIEFSQSSSCRDTQSTKWDGSAGFSKGWLSVGASGGSSTETAVGSDESFSMSMSFKGLQTVTTVGGDWLNLAVLRNHPNGPWKKGSSFENGDAHPWGKGGLFNLVPTAVTLAYQPNIELTMSASAFEQTKSSWTTGAKVCAFGIFCFGGEVQHTSVHYEQHGDSYTVTLKDDSNMPNIVAMTNNPINSSAA